MDLRLGLEEKLVSAEDVASDLAQDDDILAVKFPVNLAGSANLEAAPQSDVTPDSPIHSKMS